MRLIVISSGKSLEQEIQIVTDLFEAGLPTFHLKKDLYSTRRMAKFIRQIPKQYHDRIVIHSHHKLARRFKLKGIHLSKPHKKRKWRTLVNLRLVQLRNPHIQLSTSVKTLGSLYSDAHELNYDTLFLSPVFDHNSSKYQGGFSVYSLKIALEKTKYKVVARGGADIQAIQKANELGFDGLAFYSIIWRNENPIRFFQEILAEFERLGIKVE